MSCESVQFTFCSICSKKNEIYCQLNTVFALNNVKLLAKGFSLKKDVSLLVKCRDTTKANPSFSNFTMEKKQTNLEYICDIKAATWQQFYC